jgi:hypothetical protein
LRFLDKVVLLYIVDKIKALARKALAGGFYDWGIGTHHLYCVCIY